MPASVVRTDAATLSLTGLMKCGLIQSATVDPRRDEADERDGHGRERPAEEQPGGGPSVKVNNVIACKNKACMPKVGPAPQRLAVTLSMGLSHQTRSG